MPPALQTLIDYRRRACVSLASGPAPDQIAFRPMSLARCTIRIRKRTKVSDATGRCARSVAARECSPRRFGGKAVRAIELLRERVADADPTISREALNRVCERVEVRFDHLHSEKMIRSHFKKGLIRFRPLQDSVAPGAPVPSTAAGRRRVADSACLTALR
jgi:hypothetical protein